MYTNIKLYKKKKKDCVSFLKNMYYEEISNSYNAIGSLSIHVNIKMVTLNLF